MNNDVIIVGGGPAGLLLASELGVAGVPAVVIERLATRDERLRSQTLTRLSAQILERHGMLVQIDADRSPSDPLSPMLSVRQQAVEHVLEARAIELGVDIRREREFRTLQQDSSTVTVQVRDASGAIDTLRASYLVGCDGAHSAVRQQVGFTTTGTEPTLTGYQAVATVKTPSPPPPPPRYHARTPTGIAVWTPGKCRVITLDFTGPPDRDGSGSLEELQATLRRITGVRLTLTDPVSVTRFTDTTMLADCYRRGRVLLAGDAAHHHAPTGAGQGMNVALGDAANLGWKLAASIRGWARPDLLDTYDAERRPVGALAIRNSRAEMLLLQPDERFAPAHELHTDIWGDPAIKPHLTDLMSMVRVRYDMGSATDQAHPLLGRAAGELVVHTAAGPCRLARLLHDGRGLLLDCSGRAEPASEATPWKGRIDVCTGSCSEPGLEAVLVRPDGYVAWLHPTDGPAQPGPLPDSLRTWFGRPGLGSLST